MPKGHVRFLKPPPKARPAPPPAFTCDDFEGQEWFARMPRAAQEEMRERVKAAEARDAKRGLFAKTTRKRAMTQGAVVFFIPETICAVPSWGHSAAALVAGALVGALWHKIGAGRFRCAATSALPYVALRVVFASGSYLADSILAIFGFAMLTALTAALGYERECRRSDGFDC